MGDNQLIQDIGRIACASLPASWHKAGSQETGWASPSQSLDFSPSGRAAQNVLISFYRRGTPVSEESAEHFKTLLEEPCHNLTASELDSIRQILSKMADEDAFELRNASTNIIGGIKVLSLDGEWKRSSKQFHGILYPSKSCPQQIEEVFFEAPPLDYLRYLHEAASVIKSLQFSN